MQKKYHRRPVRLCWWFTCAADLKVRGHLHNFTVFVSLGYQRPAVHSTCCIMVVRRSAVHSTSLHTTSAALQLSGDLHFTQLLLHYGCQETCNPYNFHFIQRLLHCDYQETCSSLNLHLTIVVSRLAVCSPNLCCSVWLLGNCSSPCLNLTLFLKRPLSVNLSCSVVVRRLQFTQLTSHNSCQDTFIFFTEHILYCGCPFTFTYPLTVGVTGAPQMTS